VEMQSQVIIGSTPCIQDDRNFLLNFLNSLIIYKDNYYNDRYKIICTLPKLTYGVYNIYVWIPGGTNGLVQSKCATDTGC